jgi:hypothetical protein
MIGADKDSSRMTWEDTIMLWELVALFRGSLIPVSSTQISKVI